MKTQIVLTLANDITLSEYVKLLGLVKELSPEYFVDMEVKVND